MVHHPEFLKQGHLFVQDDKKGMWRKGEEESERELERDGLELKVKGEGERRKNDFFLPGTYQDWVVVKLKLKGCVVKAYSSKSSFHLCARRATELYKQVNSLYTK